MVAGRLKTCGYRTSALSGPARSSMLQAAAGLASRAVHLSSRRIGQVRAGRRDAPASARDSHNDKNNDKNDESAL